MRFSGCNPTSQTVTFGGNSNVYCTIVLYFGTMANQVFHHNSSNLSSSWILISTLFQLHRPALLPPHYMAAKVTSGEWASEHHCSPTLLSSSNFRGPNDIIRVSMMAVFGKRAVCRSPKKSADALAAQTHYFGNIYQRGFQKWDGSQDSLAG